MVSFYIPLLIVLVVLLVFTSLYTACFLQLTLKANNKANQKPIEALHFLIQAFLTWLSCSFLFAWERLRCIRSSVPSGTFQCGLLCSMLIGHLSSYGCENVLMIPFGLACSAQKPLLGSWFPVP